MQKRMVPTLTSLLSIAFLVSLLLPPSGFAKGFNYTQLRDLVKNGKTSDIKKVTLTIGGTYADAAATPVEVQLVGSDEKYSVLVPPETRERLINALDQAGVDLEVRESDKSSYWFSLLSSFFLPILLLVGFLFMFKSAQRVPSSSSSSSSNMREG